MSDAPAGTTASTVSAVASYLPSVASAASYTLGLGNGLFYAVTGFGVGAASAAAASSPEVADFVFGEKLTDAERIDRQARQLTGVERQLTRKLDIEREKMKNVQREIDALMRKGSTGDPLRNAIYQKESIKRQITTYERGISKIRNGANYVTNAAIDLKITAANIGVVDALSSVDAILEQQGGSMELVSEMREQAMKAEARQMMLDQTMGGPSESSIDASVDAAYEAAKQQAMEMQRIEPGTGPLYKPAAPSRVAVAEYSPALTTSVAKSIPRTTPLQDLPTPPTNIDDPCIDDYEERLRRLKSK
jgi:hypothetical protein